MKLSSSIDTISIISSSSSLDSKDEYFIMSYKILFVKKNHPESIAFSVIWLLLFSCTSFPWKPSSLAVNSFFEIFLSLHFIIPVVTKSRAGHKIKQIYEQTCDVDRSFKWKQNLCRFPYNQACYFISKTCL